MPTRKKRKKTNCRHQLGICFCCCYAYYCYLCGLFVCCCFICVRYLWRAQCSHRSSYMLRFCWIQTQHLSKNREVRVNSCNLNVQCSQGNNSQSNVYFYYKACSSWPPNTKWLYSYTDLSLCTIKHRVWTQLWVWNDNKTISLRWQQVYIVQLNAHDRELVSVSVNSPPDGSPCLVFLLR